MDPVPLCTCEYVGTQRDAHPGSCVTAGVCTCGLQVTPSSILCLRRPWGATILHPLVRSLCISLVFLAW